MYSKDPLLESRDGTTDEVTEVYSYIGYALEASIE
jgi:hypothetical protein